MAINGLRIGTWNVDTILIQVFKFFYQSLGLIFLIIWKLCALQHRQFFFIITVDWRRNLKFIGKVWFRFIRVNLILNVKNIFEWWKSFIRWTNEILRIFCSFFSDYFQSLPILKFRWLCRINYMKIYQTLLSFIRSIYSEKY